MAVANKIIKRLPRKTKKYRYPTRVMHRRAYILRRRAVRNGSRAWRLRLRYLLLRVKRRILARRNNFEWVRRKRAIYGSSK